MRFYKYTPALLDPKTLEDTLIGRDLELDNLKRILKSAAAGKSCSHPILIGPKGIGKSHMLRIIYHAVKGNIKTKGLNTFKDKYIPVIFSEEEYPSNITKFIKLILQYLMESDAGSFPPVPEELMKAVAPSPKNNEDAISYIKTFKKKTGKILLLLVDNLNDIIDRFTDKDQSSLREMLMANDSLLLVGAAPTLFDSIINHDKPFYNFFEIIWLKDLSFEDTVALLNKYAELEDRNDLIEEFKAKEAKLRAIHELAGGNPRLILSLYHILVEGDITSIENTFLKLLDELSPYFRERMKDLSEQQKEIIDVMARAESLLTPTEIAGRCQVPVNLINSQLKRLEKIGCVQVAKKHAKKVFYDFNERLFSLWRQMRVEAGRRRLGFFVKFLEIWFTKGELLTSVDKILNELRGKISISCSEFPHEMDKLWYLKEAVPELKGKDEICVACKRKDYDIAINMVNRTLTTKPNDAELLAKLGCIYIRLKKYGEALEVSKKAISIKPNNYKAWCNIGTVYKEQKKYKDAIEAYKRVIDIKSTHHGAWFNLGNIYANSLKQFDKAIEAYKKAIDIRPKQYETWGNIGATYIKLKHYEDAIQAFKESVELGATSPEIWNAWYSLGYAYMRLKKFDKARNACEKSIEKNPDENCSWYILGNAHIELKNYSDARVAFKKAVEIKHCKDCVDKAWFMLCITYISIFIDESNKGNIDVALSNLRESFHCLPHISSTDKHANVYAKAFKSIIQSKRIDLLKNAIKELALANQTELLKLLSPFSTLVKYLEAKDPEIIDRLRREERIVVDDMLKMLGEKVEEKPKKLRARGKKPITH